MTDRPGRASGWYPMRVVVTVALAVVTVAMVAAGTRPCAADAPRVSVDLDALRLRGGTREARVGLPLTCPSDVGDLRVEAEVLDADGRAIWTGVTQRVTPRGCRRAAVDLGRKKFPTAPDGLPMLPEHRLRFRVLNEAGAVLLEGTRHLALFAEQAFDIKFLYTVRARWTDSLPVRVSARRPITGEPVRGVRVTLSSDDARDPDRPLDVVTTGPDGTATAHLDGRRLADEWHPEVVATAQLGPFEHELDLPFGGAGDTRVALATDKRRYQPGERVRMRVLVFGPDGRAAAGRTVTFSGRRMSEDLFRQDARTDDFGVAHADWQPAGSPGEVSLEAEVRRADGGETVRSASAYIEIRPYDLPAFTIEVAPDRPYFLPDDDPTVVVTARWLDGRPLQGAAVVVAADPAGHGIMLRSGAAPSAGQGAGSTVTTGPDGTARVDVPLADEFAGLRDSRRGVEDVTFRALVADPATGRREERSFVVRAALHPLQAYVVDAEEVAGLPSRLVVSSFTAAGEPVSAEVCVGPDRPAAAGVRACGRTNRFGLGRVELPLADVLSDVVLEVRDERGRTGLRRDYLSSYARLARLDARRTVLAPGEPVELLLEAALPDRDFLVLLLGDSGEIAARTVRTVGGRAGVTFPFRPAMRGVVAARAVPRDRPYQAEIDDAPAAANVVYRDTSALTLSGGFEAPEARPGERAHARFRLADAAGRPVPAALGVVALDTAYEERLRNEGEGAPETWFAAGHMELDAEEEFAGHRLAEIVSAPPAPGHEPDADVELLSAVLVRDAAVGGLWGESATFDEAASDALGKSLREDLERRRDELAAWHAAHPDAGARDLERHVENGELPGAADPWGHAVSIRAACAGDACEIVAASAGADGRRGTPDDLEAGRTGWTAATIPASRVSDAVVAFRKSSGRWPLEAADIDEALSRAGLRGRVVDLDGGAYEVAVEASRDDVVVRLWPASRPWVAATAFRVSAYEAVFRGPVLDAVRGFAQARGRLPATREEFEDVLRGAGCEPADFHDLEGRAYDVAVCMSGRVPDRVNLVVIQEGWHVRQAIALRDVLPPASVASLAPTRDRSVAVAFVEDAALDPVEGATVQARLGEEVVAQAASDRDGVVVFGDLAPGTYDLLVEHPAFHRARVQAALTAGAITRVTIGLADREGARSGAHAVRVLGRDFTSDVATVEQVTVSAAHSQVSTERRSASSAATMRPVDTPRVRKEFPETLLWLPDLRTAPDGTVSIPVPLADTITRWHLQAVASTKDGRIAVADSSILVRLPFAVELEVPRTLTRGDRLQVGAVVHNAQDASEDVSIAPAATGAVAVSLPVGTLRVAPQAVAVAAVEARATGRGRGTLRMVAKGAVESDAIEREVEVRPLGRRVTHVEAAVVTGERELSLVVPPSALPGEVEARVIVHASLASQVERALEGLQQQPIGCAEQITSAAYLSLWQLQDGAALPRAGAGQENAWRRRIAEAVRKLEGRVDEDGGVVYFGGYRPDPALASYVARFLWDAVALDPHATDVHLKVTRLLVQQQLEDGSWPATVAWEHDSAARRRVEAAYIARNLAAILARVPGDAEDRAPVEAAVRRAVAFTAAGFEADRDPYVLGCTALAALAAKDGDVAGRAVELLARTAVVQRGEAHWASPRETVFRGAGLPGTIEATSVAALALATSAGGARRDLVDAARLYLLQHRGDYAGWWSTQATALAVEALLATSPAAGRAEPRRVAVEVDGRPAGPLTFDPAGVAEIVLDPGLGVGPHRVVVRGEAKSELLAEIRATWFEGWGDAAVRADEGAPALSVSFDTRATAVGEPIACRVSLTDGRRRGMQVAEIGLPPGAAVDASELEAARWSYRIHAYEIWPDRIVVYTWSWGWRPDAPTPLEFTFRFRPRFAGTYWSAPSGAYAYYDPASRVDVPPVAFEIQPPAANAAREPRR